MTTFMDVLHAHRTRSRSDVPIAVACGDPWLADARYGDWSIRSLGADDQRRLLDFAVRLGRRGREMFCPYPWDDPDRLQQAFGEAIAKAQARIDAMYLMEAGEATIAHCFLWKAGGNPHSAQDGVEVSELGVAVAEAWQGRGIGSLLVRWLQAAASQLGCDAIELTTAMENDAGWAAYRSAGFDQVGIIRTPLGVDVTAAALGAVTATRFRDERQMVWIQRQDRRDQVIAYLARKRRESETM